MSKRVNQSKADATVKSRKTSLGESSKNIDDNEPTEKPKPKFTFKNHDFEHSGIVKSGRKISWKNLKAIATSERAQAPYGAPVYLSLESPPSIKPAPKYSDISGQVAKYTDPETGLYYSSVQEFKQIKRLTPDLVQGYLDIRQSIAP